MAHPFEKMFERALRKCTTDENEVLIEAVKIHKKGYSVHEISEVLRKLKISLIDEKDEAIVQDALDEFVELYYK